MGYWERRASEQAAEQDAQQGGQPYPTTPYPQGGPVFNPTSAQDPPPPQAQPAPPPQPAPGYAPGSQGGRPYGQSPYGQDPYGQPTPPSYGGQPAGPTPGQPRRRVSRRRTCPMPPYGGYVAPPPDHPQATLALVLAWSG